ncbi:MAG: glycosyltransferase family 4 protein [Gammaproteobacteria bacterium]
MRNESVMVCNLSAPEINRLGVELARLGVLKRYVRPYANMQRWWERALAHAPGVGKLYHRTLGRRVLPAGLPRDKVIEAGVAQDFAAAGVARLPFMPTEWRRHKTHELNFAAERAVARKAARLTDGVTTVVASYGTGRFAFEAVQRAGGRAVLSYPIAHNRYQMRLYAEEAELAPEFAAALPRMEWLPREYSERLERECAMADRIIVGSSFVKQSFVELGYDASRIAITPYGVDTERFTPRAEPRRDGMFRALFVGQIGQRKGMSYLLQGYEKFRRSDSELHIVGSYAPGHEVYARYDGIYRHTPHVPQKDLPSLLREADVFVFPSLIEGMPLVVLEAMACGLPIITTTHGPADIVRDGVDGFFVPIRDSEAIAARLEQLYRDPALREQMGRNAREQALRHTWQAYAQCAADAVLTDPSRPDKYSGQAASIDTRPLPATGGPGLPQAS